jgi:hypothetical protein
MKIDDYTPYISALSIQFAPNTQVDKIIDQKLLRIQDVLLLSPGKYFLSLNNPRCSIDKKITKEIGTGLFLKRDNLIKYYLVDAVVNIGTDSIEDVASKLIAGANITKSILIENAPDFQKYFVDNIDASLKELLTINGLKYLLPIARCVRWRT